ncbi:hypothetical protein D3C73_798980 [compost metagenome]
MLGRDIVAHAAVAVFACLGGNVDDAAASALAQHLSCSRLGDQIYAFGVDIHDLIPVFLPDIDGIIHCRGSAVVHQKVDRAKSLHSGINQPRCVCTYRNVNLDLHQPVMDRFNAGAAGDISDYYIRSGLKE